MRLGAGLALGLAARGAVAAPPLAAYGQLPNISDIEVSPDGTRYGALVGNETKREVQIRTLGSNALIEVFPIGNLKVRALQWAGPNHLLLTKSTAIQVTGLTGPKHEWFQLGDYDLRKKRWNMLLKSERDSMNVIIGTPTALIIDGKPIVVAAGVYFLNSQGLVALFRIDLDRQTTTRIEVGTVDTSDFLVGSDGVAVARGDYIEARRVWTLMLKKPGGAWTRNHSEDAPIDRPDLRGLSPDGASILVGSHSSGGWQTRAVGIADGKWSDALPDIEEDGLLLDPATHRMIGSVKVELEGERYRFVDAADQKRWDAIAGHFRASRSAWRHGRRTAARSLSKSRAPGMATPFSSST